MLITITSKNTGSKDAYQTSYKFIFSKYVEIITDIGDIFNKKEIITSEKNVTNGDTIISINSNRQIPQNTKDAYYIYLKFDFGKKSLSSSVNNLRNLDEDEDGNEKVILKSADVTLCQNIECNNQDSFVKQIVNINFKIERNIYIESVEDEEEIQKEYSEEEKKSISWIVGPIVAFFVIIGFAIFFYFDYKRKILFFKKNKHETIPSSEFKDNNEDVNMYNVKNQNSNV
jgi:hypothetical protein